MAKFIIGLTGGIGSGKSAASHAFEKHNITVVDADQVARDVVAPGSEGLKKVAATFGEDILLADGQLNRPALRARIFNDPKQKQHLETILHPLIQARVFDLLAQAKSPYAIYAAPLLIESNGQHRVNRVAVVDVPEPLQRQRSAQRDQQSEQQIQAIMKTQLNRAERLSYADDVIDNSGDIASLEKQVEQLHQYYLKLSQTKDT